MRLIALLIAALPLCAAAQPPNMKAQLERMAVIDRFVWDGPLFLQRKSGEDVRKLGEVISESTDVVTNPHTEGSINYTKLKFKDGLEIFFRSFGSPVEVQYIGVTVTSPKWSIKGGLNVGVPVEHVLKMLGEPNNKTANEIIFSGETEKVTFRVKNAHVTEVLFSYYAD